MFLRKKREGDRRALYLGNLKLFSYTRKSLLNEFPFAFSNITDLWSYLDGYSCVSVQEDPLGGVESEYVKPTWLFWWQGVDAAPDIVKSCVKSVRHHARGKVIVLDRNNLCNYLVLPSAIRTKFESGTLPLTQFSDYIRAAILSKFGGFWFDATCYQSADVPDEIINAPFFVFSNPVWLLNPNSHLTPKLFDVMTKFHSAPHHIGSSWFIAARKGHYAMRLMAALLTEYWQRENQLLDYFIFHDFLSFIFLSRESLRICWRSMPKYSNEPPHWLQSILFDAYDEGRFNNVLKASFVHKLTYKGLSKVAANSVLTHIASR